jgi:hypothetical protein
VKANEPGKGSAGGEPGIKDIPMRKLKNPVIPDAWNCFTFFAAWPE